QIPHGQQSSKVLRSALESSVRKTIGPTYGLHPKKAYSRSIVFKRVIKVFRGSNDANAFMQHISPA
ncbi:20965_t:CDS:2, partial [Gigaspora margarita]